MHKRKLVVKQRLVPPLVLTLFEICAEAEELDEDDDELSLHKLAAQAPSTYYAQPAQARRTGPLHLLWRHLLWLCSLWLHLLWLYLLWPYLLWLHLLWLYLLWPYLLWLY